MKLKSGTKMAAGMNENRCTTNFNGSLYYTTVNTEEFFEFFSAVFKKY